MAALPFTPTSQRGDPWFTVGLVSSFPNLTESNAIMLAGEVETQCASSKDTQSTHGCKVFLAPDKGDRTGQAAQLSDDPKDQLDASLRKGDQVLVFQYKGKFHAVDNVRVSAFDQISYRIH